MHLPPLITDLAIILAVAGVMSFVFQKIKQPVVLGYILAGVIVGPFTPPFQLVSDLPSIQIWAELGVIFLMFTLGLEFSFRKLLSVGITAGVTAGLEVIFFLATGYGIGKSLGWSDMDSLFLGAMLSISSTTIIIKALDELKLKSHKFASLIFGILIVEDLIAVVLLVALGSVASSKTFSPLALAGTTINLIAVVGSWFMVGHFLVPRIMSFVSRRGSDEMLTLVSIGLCLVLVVLATHFGYSAALGAFIMGSILAETPVIHRIDGLMAPLKDLFGAIFFVSIGMLIDPKVMWDFKGTITILCLITVLGKIFITSLGALISGQTFRNAIQVGFGLAQIGEFSFIIAGLGLALKVTSSHLYPIAVAVSIVTTFTTPYLIKFSNPFASRIEEKLPSWFKNALGDYVFWWEHKRRESRDLKDLLKLALRWVINAVVVVVIFNNSFKILAPKLQTNINFFNHWYMELTWFLAFVFSSPFLWGMVFTSRRHLAVIRRDKNVVEAGLLTIFPLLTAIFVGVLSIKYFSLIHVLVVTSLFLLAVYFVLFRRLESYYRWLEDKFISSFAKKEKKEGQLIGLAPWGMHLYNFQVHPNASLVGKTLGKAHLRQRLGVNIVAIYRGNIKIISPRAEEVIYPMDTLIAIGTDEQLDALKEELEATSEDQLSSQDVENYALEHIRLLEGSPLVGKTIQDSAFREHFQALVVGLERGDVRILNPDRNFRFAVNDVIWIVSEREQIEKIVPVLVGSSKDGNNEMNLV